MFLKNALAFSGINLISQILLFIQGFILRRMLPPEIMGVWNLVGVVKSFATPFSIGILAGAVRELPILKGKGDYRGQENCRSVSLTYSLVEVTVVFAGILIYALFKKNNVSETEFFAIVLAAALMYFTRLQESYNTFFQGAQLYIPLSRLLFINSLILAIALPIGAYLLGLWGVFLGAIFAEGIKAAWMTFSARRFDIRTKFMWDANVFKRLASYSIFCKIADYPISLFLMLDMFWVTKFMDIKSLGIYMMARSFFVQGADISIRFGTVLMTRTFEQYGKGEDREKIALDIYNFIQFQLLVAIPLINWGIITAAPLLIRQVIPLYAGGILPLAILLTANFFDLRNNNLFTIWVAEKRLGSYGVANILSLGMMVVLFIVMWFIMGIKTMAGVAFVVVAAYACNFTYIVFTLGKELLGRKRALVIYAEGIPIALWMGTIFVYFGQQELLCSSLTEDIIFTLKKSVVILILILPPVILGIRNSGAAKYLAKRLREGRIER
ncbi:MAG: hypothetical protein VR68_09275 [Peptococcaceae bacterium BRH_c4a]|nr:MAG: hypothetical protein VR68_09275 [Peptococcaceae bacterium BRH_c4a]